VRMFTQDSSRDSIRRMAGHSRKAGIAGAVLVLLMTFAAPALAGGTYTFVYGPAASPVSTTKPFSGATSDIFDPSSTINGVTLSGNLWMLATPGRTTARASVTGNAAGTAQVTVTNAMQTYTLTAPPGASFAGGKLVIYAALGPGDIAGNGIIDLALSVAARQGGNWEATGSGQRSVDAGAGSEEVEVPVVIDLPTTLDAARATRVEPTMVLNASANIAPSGGATQSAIADAFQPGGSISGFSVLNAAGVQVTGFTLKGGQLTVAERAPPPPGWARAVEFFHPEFDHYFITTSPVEIENLDSGKTPGWQRTGQSFNVYATADSGLAAVCRFFSGESFGLKSSHFYAPRGLGCEAVFNNPQWQYEGDVFFTPLPAADGACPAGTAPVYRLYNNGMGGAPNHRYTTSDETFAAMKRDGWIAEGQGEGVGMCSPL
jgi:hypothetical protein